MTTHYDYEDQDNFDSCDALGSRLDAVRKTIRKVLSNKRVPKSAKRQLSRAMADLDEAETIHVEAIYELEDLVMRQGYTDYVGYPADDFE